MMVGINNLLLCVQVMAVAKSRSGPEFGSKNGRWDALDARSRESSVLLAWKLGYGYKWVGMAVAVDRGIHGRAGWQIQSRSVLVWRNSGV